MLFRSLLLGRLQPARFLGGEFTLELDRTRRVVAAWLKAKHSRMSAEEFSAGVIRVVNATMEKAVRVVSVERGYDPRDFVLVAFGGAGGLHACELANALGIRRVMVPAMPGALSAFGILVSDVVKDYSRTVVWRTGSVDWQRSARSEFARLRAAAVRGLRHEKWTGKTEFSETMDLRYRGQGYELNVPHARDSLAAFHAEHQRRYGYAHPDREVEIVTLRLRARVPSGHVNWNPERTRTQTPAEDAKVWIDGRVRKVTLLDRDSLRPGRRLRGPAVVTEYSATTWVPRGATFYLDRAANLIIETA